MEHIIQSGVNTDEEEFEKIIQKQYEDIFDKLGQEIRKMKTMSKSDLKTGYILTFSDGLKGIVIKDVNGDESKSLILYIKDDKVDGCDYVDWILDNALWCLKNTFGRERKLVKVEKIKDAISLGMLLNPSDNYYTVGSVPKTTLLNRSKKILYKGDIFYTIEPCQVFDGEAINIYSIEDIYVTDNTTFLVTPAGREFNVRSVYFTREEAEKALKK